MVIGGDQRRRPYPRRRGSYKCVGNLSFLRSYPALQSKSDNQLGKIVAKLHDELIETDADLNQVSRDSLLSKLPALALDALKPQQQKRGRSANLRKHTKHQDTAPASIGKETPKPSQPRKSPSSEEGKAEGLQHASEDDASMLMQSSSSPACMSLLKLLEDCVRDQKNNQLDRKFTAAARIVINARYRLSEGKLPREIGTNERFFTGAMTNALNSVLQDGFCVLHQACLGVGATHSDISVTRVHEDSTSGETVTLMVGEGKWNASHLRNETRGQIYNELLRHRAIDNARTDRNGPILLFAFDKSRVEIDLAFHPQKVGSSNRTRLFAFRKILKKAKRLSGLVVFCS